METKNILAIILVAASIAACSSASVDEPELRSGSPLVSGGATEQTSCELAPADSHARCDGTSEYTAKYVPPQPAVSTGQRDRAAAEAVCARYMIRHGTGRGTFGGWAVDCGSCPSGTKGCEPNSFDFSSGSGLVRDPVSGEWQCGGSNDVVFKYKCSRCVIDGTCAKAPARED